jgi:ribosomal protein L11 methyltransferase
LEKPGDNFLMSTTWAEVTCESPAELVDQLADFLVTLSGNGVCIENLNVDTFSLEGLADAPVKMVKTYMISDAALHDKIEAIEAFMQDLLSSYPDFQFHPPKLFFLHEEDWANNWKQYFKPSRIGRRIVIKPTWEEWDAAEDAIILEIDPGMAFGTGTHPTSRLCLESMERIYFREVPFDSSDFMILHSDFLDVGTGSGILAIAAAKFGAERIVALDIDPKAVIIAEQNLVLNHVRDIVSLSTDPIREITGSFAVIAANILAEDLVRMAGDLAAKLRKGGFLILSGILTEKEGVVFDGFAGFPLTPVETTREGEWSCITFRLES